MEHKIKYIIIFYIFLLFGCRINDRNDNLKIYYNPNDYSLKLNDSNYFIKNIYIYDVSDGDSLDKYDGSSLYDSNFIQTNKYNMILDVNNKIYNDKSKLKNITVTIVNKNSVNYYPEIYFSANFLRLDSNININKSKDLFP